MSEVIPAAPAAPSPASPAASPAPAAAAPTPSPTPAPTAPAPAAPSWAANLAPEMRDYVMNKGFSEPSQLLDSYVNLEKLRGVPQERLLKLPETQDSPEWQDVFKKLGKPDNKEGYELKPAQGDDPQFFEWAKDTFHGLNLSKDQAQGILQKFGEYVSNKGVETSEQAKIKTAGEVTQLKKEWGAAFSQKEVTADLAIKRLGIPDGVVKAIGKEMGYAGAMKLLATIGENFGEAGFHGGGGGGGFNNAILTPSQAKDRIAALKKDPGFSAKYLSGDAEASNQMTELHKMANPSEH